MSAVGVLHAHARTGLVIKRTAFQLCQVRPGFPQAVSSPQKFHCHPNETWGTGWQRPRWTVNKSHWGAYVFQEGRCTISQNPIANDLVAVQHVTSVRQDDKQSAQSVRHCFLLCRSAEKRGAVAGQDVGFQMEEEEFSMGLGGCLHF